MHKIVPECDLPKVRHEGILPPLPRFKPPAETPTAAALFFNLMPLRKEKRFAAQLSDLRGSWVHERQSQHLPSKNCLVGRHQVTWSLGREDQSLEMLFTIQRPVRTPKGSHA